MAHFCDLKSFKECRPIYITTKVIKWYDMLKYCKHSAYKNNNSYDDNNNDKNNNIVATFIVTAIACCRIFQLTYCLKAKIQKNRIKLDLSAYGHLVAVRI